MTALREFASTAASTIYDAINVAETPDRLDQLASTMWRGNCEGAIGDDDAQFLQSCIDRRRPPTRSVPHMALGRAIGKLAGRIGSRFSPRPRRQPLTDEERTRRRHRKRELGGSSAMPNTMRHRYTEGERAVMCVVAGEVRRHGICDLSIDEIADRAGVRRTTVQNAMHAARRLGHVEITERPRRGAKNLPNIVTITSAEWHAWIKRGPSAARGIGSKTFTNVNTTKIIDLRKKEATDEERLRRGPAPPQTWCRRRA